MFAVGQLVNFPFGGEYRGKLHEYDNLEDIAGGKGSWLTVPSNYGVSGL